MEWLTQVDWFGCTCFGVVVGLPAMFFMAAAASDVSANLALAFRRRREGVEEEE